VLKQGPPPWKTWKKRWLVLTPTGLSYFSPKVRPSSSMRPPPATFSIHFYSFGIADAAAAVFCCWCSCTQGKENKYSLKGSVPASMIATVEIMAINKKKGIYGFKGELALVLP
jgi:hypothetical protein